MRTVTTAIALAGLVFIVALLAGQENGIGGAEGDPFFGRAQEQGVEGTGLDALAAARAGRQEPVLFQGARRTQEQCFLRLAPGPAKSRAQPGPAAKAQH